MADRPLTEPARDILRRLYADPDVVYAMPRAVAQELSKAGLLVWTDGGPALTAKGCNRAMREANRDA